MNKSIKLITAIETVNDKGVVKQSESEKESTLNSEVKINDKSYEFYVNRIDFLSGITFSNNKHFYPNHIQYEDEMFEVKNCVYNKEHELITLIAEKTVKEVKPKKTKKAKVKAKQETESDSKPKPKSKPKSKSKTIKE